jgi:hypothetical protein
MGPFAVAGSTISLCWVMTIFLRATRRRAAARAGSKRASQLRRSCLALVRVSPATNFAASEGQMVLLVSPSVVRSARRVRMACSSAASEAVAFLFRQASLQCLMMSQS